MYSNVCVTVEAWAEAECSLVALLSSKLEPQHVRDSVVGVQMTGRMRVIMKPLVSEVPIIGALTVFFLQTPVSYIYADVHSYNNL